MLLQRLMGKLRITVDDASLRKLLVVLFWCAALFVLFTVGFKLAEADADPEAPVGWEEAIWQSWQTFTTVGYGNRPAITTLGRVLTMALSTLGIAFVGALFGVAFDYRDHVRNKRLTGQMENPLKDGYVLFNFPGLSTTMNLIRELRGSRPEAPVCIVDSRLERLPRQIAELARVHFVRGDLFDAETYKQARLKESKAVIVFPIDPSVSASDGSTRTLVGLVERFVEPEKTRIIHILVDSKNAWLFEDMKTKSTQILGDLEVLALVQECHDRYSSTVIEQMLVNTAGANVQTFEPRGLAGWSWEELVGRSMVLSTELEQPCNYLALIKGGRGDICPSPATRIEAGDAISAVTANDFDWDRFEATLRERWPRT